MSSLQRKKFKSHKLFTPAKRADGYLFPNVCLQCCVSFRKPQSPKPRLCPKCALPMVALSRKFSAPKARDKKQWAKVRLLIEHGFLFQSVYKQQSPGVYYKVSYPHSLRAAKEFILRHAQAL